MENMIEKRPEQSLDNAERTRGGLTFVPYADICETEGELRIQMDVPGVATDGLDVRFEKGVLTLYGRVAKRDEGQGRCLAREYQVGDFHRSFRVSEAIDAGKISAEYKNGVAILHLPKVAEARPRKIEVKTA